MATDASPQTPADTETSTAVAVLLAAAAVLAAGIGGWSSILADRGSDTWHGAIRQEVKQAAGIVEQMRFVYGDEAPVGLEVVALRIEAEELERQARRSEGLARELLLVEAGAKRGAADAKAQSSDLASDERYRTGGDALDVALRLADERSLAPDLVDLDPEAAVKVGAELNRKASFLLGATIPVAVAFLLGAMVHGFPRARRYLVPAGFAFVALGLVAAAIIGVVL